MQHFFWYTADAMVSLNAMGYTHFYTKDQCDPTDFKPGQAFFYDDAKMEYGRVDTIQDNYKMCAENLARLIDPPNTPDNRGA